MTLFASAFGRIAAGTAFLLLGVYLVFHGLTLTRAKLKQDRHGADEPNIFGFLITFLPVPVARVIFVLGGLFLMVVVVLAWAGAVHS